jgi:hypothetical protein
VHAVTVQAARENAQIIAAVTRHGGHIGWIEGAFRNQNMSETEIDTASATRPCPLCSALPVRPSDDTPGTRRYAFLCVSHGSLSRLRSGTGCAPFKHAWART